jgi:hypothetical protein
VKAPVTVAPTTDCTVVHGEFARWNSLLRPKNSLLVEIFFLVNLLRELFEKSLRHRGYLPAESLRDPKIANFPVKFPVSREFGRRQVRSRLRRQPSIPAFSQAPPSWRFGRMATSHAEPAPLIPAADGSACMQRALSE